MNRDEAKKYLEEVVPVIKAYADGADVCSKTFDDGSMTHVHDPTFDYRFEWGIKPKPIEGWVNAYEGNLYSLLYMTEKEATRDVCSDYTYIKTIRMREVPKDEN